MKLIASMQSFEQVRAVFDEAGFGLIFIGRLGEESGSVRSALLEDGLVHEFRPLNATEVSRILGENGWAPAGLKLPKLDEPTISAVIRITSGNFRLIDRSLTQVGRCGQSTGRLTFGLNELARTEPLTLNGDEFCGLKPNGALGAAARGCPGAPLGPNDPGGLPASVDAVAHCAVQSLDPASISRETAVDLMQS